MFCTPSCVPASFSPDCSAKKETENSRKQHRQLLAPSVQLFWCSATSVDPSHERRRLFPHNYCYPEQLTPTLFSLSFPWVGGTGAEAGSPPVARKAWLRVRPRRGRSLNRAQIVWRWIEVAAQIPQSLIRRAFAVWMLFFPTPAVGAIKPTPRVSASATEQNKSIDQEPWNYSDALKGAEGKRLLGTKCVLPAALHTIVLPDSSSSSSTRGGGVETQVPPGSSACSLFCSHV